MAMVKMIGPKSEGGTDRAPSGGKALGASAEHSPPPSIHLGHEHMKKLGLHKAGLRVGDKIHVHAIAHVGAVSEDQAHNPSGGKAPGGEGNTHHTATLHFHHMEVGTKGIDGAGQQEQEAKNFKGAKAEMDKALEREIGGKGKKRGKNEEGYEGAEDNTPRGSNGPSGP